MKVEGVRHIYKRIPPRAVRNLVMRFEARFCDFTPDDFLRTFRPLVRRFMMIFD